MVVIMTCKHVLQVGAGGEICWRYQWGRGCQLAQIDFVIASKIQNDLSALEVWYCSFDINNRDNKHKSISL